MSRIAYLIVLWAVSVTVAAQVTVEARIDSVSLMVGEQAEVILDITAPAKSNITMPIINRGQVIIGDVEVVDAGRVDTATLDEGKLVQLTRCFTITSFSDHDTLYQLPPFVVNVDGSEQMSNSLPLKIFTLDVDTIHVDRFFPEKSIALPSVLWEDIKTVVYTCVVMFALLFMIAFLVYRYRTGKSIILLQLRREKKLPPHQVALNEINRIKAERKWADEDSKEYYTLLTDALRNYISDRYGFSAMEMTSTEIIDQLLKQDDVMLDELRQLFSTADLVKFAKASTLIGENDMNLVNAITYIQQTKIEEDPNAKPEPEPVSKEQLRYTHQRRLMLVFILMGVVGVAWTSVYIIYRLWDLFS